MIEILNKILNTHYTINSDEIDKTFITNGHNQVGIYDFEKNIFFIYLFLEDSSNKIIDKLDELKKIGITICFCPSVGKINDADIILTLNAYCHNDLSNYNISNLYKVILNTIEYYNIEKHIHKQICSELYDFLKIEKRNEIINEIL